MSSNKPSTSWHKERYPCLKTHSCGVMYTLTLTLPSIRFSGNSCGLMFQKIGFTVAIPGQPHQPKWEDCTIQFPGPLYAPSFKQGLLVPPLQEPEGAEATLLLLRGALSNLTKDNALMPPLDGSTVKICRTENMKKVKCMEVTRTGSEAPDHHSQGVTAGHHYWITAFFNKTGPQVCHARAPKLCQSNDIKSLETSVLGFRKGFCKFRPNTWLLYPTHRTQCGILMSFIIKCMKLQTQRIPGHSN